MNPRQQNEMGKYVKVHYPKNDGTNYTLVILAKGCSNQRNGTNNHLTQSTKNTKNDGTSTLRVIQSRRLHQERRVITSTNAEPNNDSKTYENNYEPRVQSPISPSILEE
jgi:hypothetical protein